MVPIRIGLRLDDGMVNAVHPRRDDDVIEGTLNSEREPPVRVMKKAARFKNDLKNEIDQRRNPEEQHDENTKGDRETISPKWNRPAVVTSSSKSV
jgi:hypothetical protein